MIYGVGTDIVNIFRIESILAKYGSSFILKILTPLEANCLKNYSKAKISNFIAKRFAAKEAISKAFGTGIGDYLSFKDISILNSTSGRPYAIVNTSRICLKKKFKINISIADDYPVAVAFSIVTI